ncbi:MAG: hypothetical protein ACP5OC_07870 [Thermoplasmata archaeon]
MEISKRDGSGEYIKAFKEFRIKNGTTIGVFQGSRGNNPDLDIIVKYKEPGKQVRTPKHLHWAIDLLIKKEHGPQLTKKFVRYLLSMWDKVTPFRTKEEQQKCLLKYSREEDISEFLELDGYGEYSVEFIAKVMELIMIQEKTGLATAFMFKGVLESIYYDKDIFTIVASAGFNGRN